MTKRRQNSKGPVVRRETRNPPAWVRDGLRQVMRLMDDQQYGQAGRLLMELDAQHPDCVEVLRLMAEVAQELHEPAKLQYACRRLLAQRPNDPEARLGLAIAYMMQDFLALGLKEFKEFLRVAPDHTKANEIRELIAHIEDENQWGGSDLPAEKAFKLAMNHERVQVHLVEGELLQAERLAKSVLRQHPDYVPLLNNLSLIHRQLGQLGLALEDAQRVLELEPANVHALANQIQCMVFMGRSDEARVHAEPLKRSTDRAWEGPMKKAEALVLLEDYEGVLEVHHQHLQEDAEGSLLPPAEALLMHFAAVASMYLGREEEARGLWKEALKLQPGDDLIHKNLQDLDLPLRERNGAWAFRNSFWFTTPVWQGLQQIFTPALPSGNADEQMMVREVRRFVRKYPEIRAIARNVLANADAETRGFFLILAEVTQDPVLLNATKDFALGQRGSDGMRLRALSIAGNANVIDGEETPMWVDGEWRLTKTNRILVSGEPTTSHGPEVMALLDEATSAMENRDWKKAEALFLQASTIEPDAPDLQGNRAVMVEYQGRIEEAENLLRQVHERFPDYVFARTNLAREHIKRGELEEARKLLEPLADARRLHVLELRAVCTITIELAVAEKDHKSAEHWLRLWESLNPDDPELERYRAWVAEQFAPSEPTRPTRPAARRHRGGL